MIRNVLLGGAFLLGNIAAWAQNTEGPTFHSQISYPSLVFFFLTAYAFLPKKEFERA